MMKVKIKCSHFIFFAILENYNIEIQNIYYKYNFEFGFIKIVSTFAYNINNIFYIEKIHCSYKSF